MSRRPDKAAQNQQVIKNLLKLEANKNCADCKRNKHPRWASWNLGVFVCIRCSGIHRGMGTHISRVKSVDLDAWTDEQLQSIMKWGNARANRYWESKLAAGHVPSDAKIENFIRTKYESKRWVMDGPMPDPSTLGSDGDEDVPLTTIQERARLDRSSSQRVSSTSSQPSRIQRAQEGSRALPPAASFNLIDGDDSVSIPQRPSTTEPQAAARQPPPGRAAAPPPSQLLGGLDFLGGPPERPSSTLSGGSSMTRPDLKQSILSLYASKPNLPSASQPVPQSVPQPKDTTMPKPSSASPGNNFAALNDAFGSLSFGSTATAPRPLSTSQQSSQPSTQTSAFAAAPKPQPAKPDAYAALSGVLSSTRSSIVSPQTTSPPALSGGGFFDSGAKPSMKPATPSTKSNAAPPLMAQASADDWGDFNIAGDSKPVAVSQTVSATKNSTLLDFTSGAAAGFSAPSIAPTTMPDNNSVFQLSSKPAPAAAASKTIALSPGFSSDPWSSNEWTTSDPAPQPKASSNTATSKVSDDFGWSAPSDWGTSTADSGAMFKPSLTDAAGWGSTDVSDPVGQPGVSGSLSSTAPKVQPEEDFGGWGAEQVPARPTVVKQPSQPQTGGSTMGGNSEDLFANVWG